MPKNDLKNCIIYKWVPLASVCVKWRRAQGELNPKRVAELVAEFDLAILEALVVCPAGPDGLYHAIDGQHRAEALRKIFPNDPGVLVPCKVIDAATPERAAEIWLKLNTWRRRKSPLEEFTVAVYARRRPQIDIDRLTREMGFVVTKAKHAKCLSCVGALQQIWTRLGGEAALRTTLLIAFGAYGEDHRGFQGQVLLGIATFLNLAGEQLVDQHRLVERMRRDTRSITPDRLLHSGHDAAQNDNTALSRGIARRLREIYNVGLRTGKIAWGEAG